MSVFPVFIFCGIPLLLVIYLALSIRILQKGEKLIVYRLGANDPIIKTSPGLYFIFFPFDQAEKRMIGKHEDYEEENQ